MDCPWLNLAWWWLAWFEVRKWFLQNPDLSSIEEIYLFDTSSYFLSIIVVNITCIKIEEYYECVVTKINVLSIFYWQLLFQYFSIHEDQTNIFSALPFPSRFYAILVIWIIIDNQRILPRTTMNYPIYHIIVIFSFEFHTTTKMERFIGYRVLILWYKHHVRIYKSIHQKSSWSSSSYK